MSSNRRFRGFSSHPRLEGTHAILSASNYHWVNYTDEQMINRLNTLQAAARGTRLHAWAAEAILLGRIQPEDGDILAVYINDAIELGMKPERTLFHSYNAYGTTDCIGFEEYEDHDQFAGFLRIHDFKSGVTKASEMQLYIYAAFFCLEYGFLPYEIDGELRIYQGNAVSCFDIDRSVLAKVYDKTSRMNDLIEERGMGELA